MLEPGFVNQFTGLTQSFPEARKNLSESAAGPHPGQIPFISVIIPAHNEEGYLKATLESLQKQDYQEFDIVVVANGCTDRTIDTARGRCHR